MIFIEWFSFEWINVVFLIIGFVFHAVDRNVLARCFTFLVIGGSIGNLGFQGLIVWLEALMIILRFACLSIRLFIPCFRFGTLFSITTF